MRLFPSGRPARADRFFWSLSGMPDAHVGSNRREMSGYSPTSVSGPYGGGFEEDSRVKA